MYAQFQHTGGNQKSDGSGQEIPDPGPLFMLPAPEEKEDDGDGDHQNDGDDQRRNTAFPDDDILKFTHLPSPPHTSTQKPL